MRSLGSQKSQISNSVTDLNFGLYYPLLHVLLTLFFTFLLTPYNFQMEINNRSYREKQISINLHKGIIKLLYLLVFVKYWQKLPEENLLICSPLCLGIENLLKTSNSSHSTIANLTFLSAASISNNTI